MSLTLKSYKQAVIVLSIDSAIESGYSDYRESYYDLSKLTVKAGQELTKFFVEPLTDDQSNMLDMIPYSRARRMQAIGFALKAVEGLMIQPEGGQAIPAPIVSRKEFNGTTSVDTDWFKQVRFPTSVIEELSEHIVRLSEPDPT